MQSTLDTRRVARAFHRNHQTYNRHAVLQRAMARELVGEILRQGYPELPRVLELGCGTGLLTRELLAVGAISHYTANDLVPELAQATASLVEKTGDCEVVCLPGDVEAIETWPRAQSLIVSGATFQWLENLPALLSRLGNYLERGGLLAFTTFGPVNCREIAALTGRGLIYPSRADINDMLGEGYTVLAARERREVVPFKSPLDVLRHLKGTGVNGVASHRWTPRGLRAFCEDYQATYPLGGGVMLTYHPMLFVARKD